MDTEDRIVTLIDEDGEAFDFVMVDSFTVDEKEYAIMVPLLNEADEEDAEDDDWDGEFENGNAGDINEDLADDYDDLDDEDLEEEEAVIFRLYRNEEGETSFQLIEDEDEWQRVSTIAFERLYQDGE